MAHALTCDAPSRAWSMTGWDALAQTTEAKSETLRAIKVARGRTGSEEVQRPSPGYPKVAERPGCYSRIRR